VRTGPILPRVLALTFFASIGAAVTWNGIFYVAHDLHHYGARDNLMLGAALGLAYALAAFFAARITGFVRTATARVFGAGVCTRTLLIANLGISAVASFIPVLLPTELGLWLFALVTVPLLGLFWPGVEQYVSSGQRGKSLNRATGYWNVCWAFALLPGMWALGPVRAHDPSLVIPLLAPLMLLSLIVVAVSFPREPGAHGEGAHEHTPAQDALYRSLLRTFRICLVVSYLAGSALAPVVPQIVTRLGVPVEWQTPLQSVWMVARLGTFIALGLWQGWHGKKQLAPVAVVLLVAGFTTALLAGSVAQLSIGLVVLGMGLGTTYAAAIYYALEVGTTDVDAGARHEAAIGLGYTLGPVLLIAALEVGWLTL
jgi:MFS family permease